MLGAMAGSSALRIPLRWRVTLLLVLFAAMNVVFTVLTRSEIAHVSGLDREGARLVRAARVEERLQMIRDEQALSIRALALTGDLRFLRDYQGQRIDEDLRGDQLDELLRSYPALRRTAERAEDAMAEWQRRLAEPIITAPPDERAQVGARLVRTVGEAQLDQVRDAVAELVIGLDRRQQATAEAVEAARSRLRVQLLTMSAASLLLIGFSVVAMRRWITVPVAALSMQAERVAGGDLDAHIQEVGPMEFQEIGRNMERMRRRIVSELRSTTQAFEALEQAAPVVSSMRDQLRARTATDLPAGLEVTAALEPAHGVLAGDWYDVIRIDEDRAAVLVVDVSGHGEEAGFRALWLKHLMVPAVRMGLAPGETLNWVAGEIGDTAEWFATCVIIEIDASTGSCLYANAGHLPPMLFGDDGFDELPVTGPLFGPLPGQTWSTGEISLKSGQMLVIYTDGIVEARNDTGEEFGDERLISCFLSSRLDDAHALTEDVMESVHSFGSKRLKDDATLAVISYHRPGGSSKVVRDSGRLHVP